MTQIDTSLFTPQREATHRVATHRGVALHPPGSPEPSELRFREAALARHGTIHHGIAHVTTETSEDFQNRKNPWISAVSQSSGLHLCKKRKQNTGRSGTEAMAGVAGQTVGPERSQHADDTDDTYRHVSVVAWTTRCTDSRTLSRRHGSAVARGQSGRARAITHRWSP